MAVIGNPRSFHKKFKYIVEIDDIGHAGFQKCSDCRVATGLERVYRRARQNSESTAASQPLAPHPAIAALLRLTAAEGDEP